MKEYENRVLKEKQSEIEKVKQQVSQALREENHHDIDDSYEYSNKNKPEVSSTIINMTYFVANLRKYNISDKACASLWNSVVKDIQKGGYLKDVPVNSSTISVTLTADRFKISSEKEKFGASQLIQSEENIKKRRL